MNLAEMPLSKMLDYPGVPKLEPVAKHGRALTFDEVVQHIGQFVIYDESTESQERFRRVLITYFGIDHEGIPLVNFRYDAKKKNFGIVRRYKGVGAGCVRKAIFYEDEQTKS